MATIICVIAEIGHMTFAWFEVFLSTFDNMNKELGYTSYFIFY